MNDKEKIRAEIEQLKKKQLARNDIGVITGVEYIIDATKLISFIDSLQQEQPEDLEKEIEKYYYDNFAFISSAHTPTKDIVSEIANHFYELGRRAER